MLSVLVRQRESIRKSSGDYNMQFGGRFPVTNGCICSSPVLLASAETGFGIAEVWEEMLRYKEVVTRSGALQSRRSQQATYWLWKHVQEQITNKIKSDENIRLKAEELEHDLSQGLIAPRAAASKILDLTTHSKR